MVRTAAEMLHCDSRISPARYASAFDPLYVLVCASDSYDERRPGAIAEKAAIGLFGPFASRLVAAILALALVCSLSGLPGHGKSSAHTPESILGQVYRSPAKFGLIHNRCYEEISCPAAYARHIIDFSRSS